jgi:hypothetical protein
LEESFFANVDYSTERIATPEFFAAESFPGKSAQGGCNDCRSR